MTPGSAARRRCRWPLAAAGTVLVVACAGACSTGETVTQDVTEHVTSATVETVEVTTRTIYTSHSVEGVVEKMPVWTATSTWGGTWVPDDATDKGSRVAVGQQLGRVVVCDDGADAGTTSGSVSGSVSDGASAASDPGCTGGVVVSHVVTAQKAGTLGTVTPAGAVTDGAQLVTVKQKGYRIRCAVSDAQSLYAFKDRPTKARALIVGGPSGFTVKFLRRTYDADQSSVVVYAKVPTSVEVYPGLKAKVNFFFGAGEKTLAVPLTAVSGDTDQGQVVVVEDGVQEVRTVTLGVQDGDYIGVSGLDAGELVLRYPLSSDFTVGG